MRTSRFLTFSLLFPTLFLGACKKDNAFDCVKSTGPIQTEIRPLPDFRTLRVFDNLEVTVVADSQSFVEVTAGKNLLSNIQTEVIKGELVLRNINKCNWVRSYDKPLQVTVHVPKLTDIFHDGDKLLRSENVLPSDTLFLHVTGAGDTDFELKTGFVWVDQYELGEVRLRGSSRALNGFVFSMGSLKATELQTKEATLKLTDQGQAFVQPSEILRAEINGPGNVYYTGNPVKIETSGNGPGKVIKAE